jgi:hypothetical protein
VEDYIQNKIVDLGFIKIEKDDEVDKINNGLIHIHATWSVASINRTEEIFQLLENLHLPKSIKRYYLDNDLITNPTYIKMLNNHGFGETIILKDGQIIYSTKFGKSLNELIDYIYKLKP